MRVSFCTNLLQVFLCELFVRICYPSFHCAQCHPKDFGLLHCFLLGKVRGKHLEELLLEHITPISPTGVASNSPSEFCALQLPNAKVVVNHIPHFRVNPCSAVVRRVLLAFTLYTLHQKNREKTAIPLHTSKKSCNFAVESPAPGLEGGKCPLSESQFKCQIPQSWLSRHT